MPRTVWDSPYEKGLVKCSRCEQFLTRDQTHHPGYLTNPLYQSKYKRLRSKCCNALVRTSPTHRYKNKVVARY